MIDIMVPPLERAFDFELDETDSADSIRRAAEKLISEREKVEFSLKQRELFSYRMGDFLKEELPLSGQGVINGDRLILI